MDSFMVDEMVRGSRASSKQAQLSDNEMRQLRSTSKAIFMQQLEPPTKGSDLNNAPKPLVEGVSYPATPRWNIERPFLTGKVFHQDSRSMLGSKGVSPDSFSMSDFNRAIGIFAPSVQELLLIDDLLFTMVGIEGKHISFKRERSKDATLSFQIDPSMDLSLQELAKRILPLCESYIIVSQFTESRSHFKYGLVNHALAAALKAILQIEVAALEREERSAMRQVTFCRSLLQEVEVGNLPVLLPAPDVLVFEEEDIVDVPGICTGCGDRLSGYGAVCVYTLPCGHMYHPIFFSHWLGNDLACADCFCKSKLTKSAQCWILHSGSQSAKLKAEQETPQSMHTISGSSLIDGTPTSAICNR